MMPQNNGTLPYSAVVAPVTDSAFDCRFAGVFSLRKHFCDPALNPQKRRHLALKVGADGA